MIEWMSQNPFIASIAALLLLGLVFGALLGFAAVKFKTEGDPIADQVEELLPQTQCGQCGYPGCRPYAEAIVAGIMDEQVSGAQRFMDVERLAERL